MDDGTPARLREPDDIPRFQFTVDLVKQMVAAELIDDDVELIDGELYPMMTKNNPHEITKRKMVYWLIRNLDDSKYLVGLEQTIYLGPRDALDPDMSIFPAHMLPEDVRGADSLLVIEVANTSLRKDTKLKAPRFAKHGIQHYWVVDVNANRTLCYANPSKSGYSEPQIVPFEQELTLPFAPELSFAIAALP